MDELSAPLAGDTMAAGEAAAAAADDVADGRDHSLDPRVVPLRRIARWIGTAATAAALLVPLLIFWIAASNLWLRMAATLAWMGVVGLNAWLAHTWPAKEFRHTRYRVDDQGIEIHRGVYFREILNVPRSRVQHTDVSQGPIERRFELGTLVIYTAGTEHAMVRLSGLEHGRAMRIRQHLLPSGAGDAV